MRTCLSCSSRHCRARMRRGRWGSTNRRWIQFFRRPAWTKTWRKCVNAARPKGKSERERKDAWRKSKESATSGVRSWRNGRAWRRGGVRREEDRVQARSSRLSKQEQIEHEMTHLPCHSWCRYGIMGRGREEGCRLSHSEWWRKTKAGDTLGLHVHGSRCGIVDTCVSGDESSVQHRSSQEVGGRMDISEVVGMALWNWVWVCGHRRQIRQRGSADELDRNVERDEGNARWIEDHRRQQPRWNWKLEDQWDHREGRFNRCKGWSGRSEATSRKHGAWRWTWRTLCGRGSPIGLDSVGRGLKSAKTGKRRTRDWRWSRQKCKECRSQRRSTSWRTTRKIDVHVGGRRVLGNWGNHGEERREEQKHSVANVLKRTVPNKWERSDLDKMAVVPCCKNEDDEKRDVERHEGETVLMDMEKTAWKSWNWKNMSHRTMKSAFNATARCSGCVVDQRNSKTCTHGEWTNQRGVERPREGGSGANACEGFFWQSRREETKRTKSNPEESQMVVSKTTTNSSSGSHDTSLKFKQLRRNSENGQPWRREQAQKNGQ